MSSIKKVLCLKAKNNHDRTFITNKVYDVDVDGGCDWVKDENGYSTCILLDAICLYGEWQPLEEYVCMTNAFTPMVKLGDHVFGYEDHGVLRVPAGIDSMSFSEISKFKKLSEINSEPKPRHEVRHVVYDTKDNKIANDAIGECYITLSEAQEVCDEMNAPKVMKPKYTKEVEYFGMNLLVPEISKYIATSQAGTVLASPKSMTTSITTWINDSSIYTVSVVELNGIDWKDTLVEIK